MSIDRFFQNLHERKYHKLFEEYVIQNGDFEIIQTIGEGSYGFAYLLQNRRTSEKRVLKRLKKKHINNQKTLRNFNQEIKFLKLGLHRNVPLLLGSGQVENIPYFTMEYIDGKTFEQLIFDEENKYSISQSIEIVKELFELVNAFHNYGIVHRDLRIPNILLRENELVIIDFGLACYMEHNIDYRTISNPKKAPSYISDLYNLGHFLLFLLYSSYNPNSKREKSWQEELQLSMELQTFIEKLLLLKPPFPDANAACQALHKIKC